MRWLQGVCAYLRQSKVGVSGRWSEKRIGMARSFNRNPHGLPTLQTDLSAVYNVSELAHVITTDVMLLTLGVTQPWAFAGFACALSKTKGDRERLCSLRCRRKFDLPGICWDWLHLHLKTSERAIFHEGLIIKPRQSSLYTDSRTSQANLTDFGTIIEKDLGGLLSRRSLIDDPLSSAAESITDISNQAGNVGAAAQDVANSASSNVPQTVGAIVDDAGDITKNISESVAKVVSGIPEFYAIGLWGYCKGTSNGTGSIVANCTTPSSSFWFNFTEVLGLESLETSLVGKIFPSQYEGVMKVYRTASKGIIAFYIMAVIASVLTTVLGLTATLSRWGSSFTSIFAIASAAFNLAGSALATGVYASLVGILKAVFSLQGSGASLGRPMLTASWLSTAFSGTDTLSKSESTYFTHTSNGSSSMKHVTGNLVHVEAQAHFVPTGSAAATTEAPSRNSAIQTLQTPQTSQPTVSCRTAMSVMFRNYVS
ncbi:hypothetical protein CNMCM7691_003890 [Aspergillus felis]|uniref:Integral membrane protein n=1 Tax=Aspergillus felis TaxID=1287682 RepID=A0A8H6R2Q6_9EURO|nr:hypothetical protein CNMCM7691_003890 [Aspergillus felis]